MIWNVTVSKDISGKDRSDAITNPKRSDLRQSEAKRFVLSGEQREANLKESKNGMKTKDRNAQRHHRGEACSRQKKISRIGSFMQMTKTSISRDQKRH